jgi:thiol:disulfide interchange protein DsbD
LCEVGRSIAAGATLAVLASAVLPVSAAAAASAWSDHDVVASRLVAGAPAANGSPRLGLHFRLKPEWHVYWKHPGDAGAPPEISIAAGAASDADGGIVVEVLYPAPQRFRLPGGLEALGYQNEVVYPLRLAAAPATADGQITAFVDYVACAVECIPFHDDLTLELPASAGAAAAEDELLLEWEARLPRAPEAVGAKWRLRYRAGDAPEIELEVAGPEPVNATGPPPELFLEPAPGATFASPERVADGRGVHFRAAVRPDVAGQPPTTLRVAWTLTGFPASDVALATVVSARAGGEASNGGEGSEARAAPASRRSDEEPPLARTAAIVALLALVPLLAALVLWLLPERLLPTVSSPLLRAAGFVAVATLVWVAYRLGALLPAARVAIVELSWLAVALAVQGATSTAGTRRRLWLLLALLAAAAGIWTTGAAWSPGMLSA